MTSFRRQVLVYFFELSDLVLLGASLYLAIFGRAALTSWSELAHKTIQVHTIVAMIVLFFVWKAALSLLGLYRSKRLTRRLPEALDLTKASTAAATLLATVAAAFGVQSITPGVCLRFFLLTGFFLIASRLLMRQFLHAAHRRGRNLRHLLIVGTNVRAIRFANGVLTRPELGYRLVGFVDDAWVGPLPDEGIGANLVASFADFQSYLRSQVVDDVVIALPIESFHDQVRDLVQVCREHGVIVHVQWGIFHASTGAADFDESAASSVMSLYNASPDSLQLAVKRLVDILVSTLLIVLFAPIMIAALIFVKFDSRGPAIFTQERIGLNKRRFRMYKFRSMVADAEKRLAELEARNEAQGPVFKIKDDPRITRIGKLLRKTSVDELPQLFNVLKGDMSLVGPRPLSVRDFMGLNEDWQRRRFSVRPGVTCLWQVSGRSSVSFDQWMHLDIQYVDRWTLWLDIKILARTIPAVVKGLGAV
jgi:exopolysaccharide biosynthesis polyprenyl glycosylphosphotransferase